MNKEWKFRMSFINIGNGDAILIEVKDEAYEDGCFVMLIDGGSGEVEEYQYTETGRIHVYDYLEQQHIQHIDVMVNTHIHEDHTCGLLEVVKTHIPREFWHPFSDELGDIMKNTSYESLDKADSDKKFISSLISYKELIKVIKDSGGKIVQVRKNEGYVNITKNLKLEVLGPTIEAVNQQMSLFREFYKNSKYEYLRELDSRMNNISLCFAINFLDRVFLLPGDTDKEGYTKVVKADVYKLGHHGQENSLNEQLLEQVSPEVAIICASSDRRYNSANPKILQMLNEKDIKMYFTDCPNVPPYTDELNSHNGVCIEVFEGSDMVVKYV